MKSTKQPNKSTPPSSEELQRRRDEKFEKTKKNGFVMSKEEFNKVMNYYDDKKHLDKIFDKMDEDKLRAAMNRNK